MIMRTQPLVLLAFAALASALLPTARPYTYTTPTRSSRTGQPLLAEPSAQAQSIDECVVDAENAAELSACADPADPSLAPTAFPGATFKAASTAVSAESKRKALMGPAGSLQECLSEAEGGAEVDECNLDYDKLVSGTDDDDSTMLNVGPIALVVIGVAAAAVNLLDAI